MTSKQNPYHMDAYSCILHAAERGESIETYIDRMKDYALKRVRMISNAKPKTE